jgi:hypothetical protein
MLNRGWVAVLLVCGGLSSEAFAQSHFASVPDIGALPGRARKSAAPDIATPLTFEAVRQETYPGLRPAVVVAESVIRLVGKGFGTEAGDRSIVIKLANAEPVALKILSWRDDEIRAELPALVDLGIDAKTASQMKSELTAKKHIVGPNTEIGLWMEGKWVIRARTAQLAVVWRDLDGDGADAIDCDDFDARRAPGKKEVADADGVDEDCNPETKGEGELATLNSPGL